MAEDGDDLLLRADALLSRHRGAAAAPPPPPAPSPPPPPAEAGPASVPPEPEPAATAPAEDDIPVLTEVIPAEQLPTVVPGPASGEVISRA